LDFLDRKTAGFLRAVGVAHVRHIDIPRELIIVLVPQLTEKHLFLLTIYQIF